MDICGIRSLLSSSQQHCTVNLVAASGIDRALLSWNDYVGWDSVSSYSVYRVTSWNTGNAQLIGTVPGNVTSYIDSNVICYEEYCYRVQAFESGGFLKNSWSDTACAEPIHIPNQIAPEVIHATVENDAEVRINWKPAPFSAVEFYLHKSLDGITWGQIATLPPSILTYLDNNVNVHNQSYYYRLAFIDNNKFGCKIDYRLSKFITGVSNYQFWLYLDWFISM